MRASAYTILSALAGATLAAAATLTPGPSLAQGGHGPTSDAVTGWRCLSPFCDTIIQPRTGCLCRKDNPNETVAARLRLTCIGNGRNNQSCAAIRQFSIR